jgi:hypothetical protein
VARGLAAGTATILVRTGGGLAWAALFNARTMGPNSGFESQIDAKLWEAIGDVTEWPTHDLFSQLP